MLISEFRQELDRILDTLSPSERKIVGEVWRQKDAFIKWPAKALLLWQECVRPSGGFHKYPEEIKRNAKSKGVAVDTRTNGPAIVAFLLAGGERPTRSNGKGWSVDHIYDGKFPWQGRAATLHAVKDGRHFTQSAGLIAVHPVAEALRDEYPYFAWLLRHEAFLRFSYDPDGVFCQEADDYGFKISQE